MSEKHPAARLAVDIGGTFTDIVLLAGERRFVAKVLTTPKAPEVAVIDGTRAVAGRGGPRLRATSACSCTARRSPPTPSSSARARAPR